MKKIIVFLLTAVFILCTLFSCAITENKIIKSLGEYEKCEFYSEGAFQDFTDYGKYYFSSVHISENEYFSRIENTDLEILNEFLNDFEVWVERIRENDPNQELATNYDFDRKIVDNGDYLYVDCEKHTWEDGDETFTKYDVYFFDFQTNVLYYFHNNI